VAEEERTRKRKRPREERALTGPQLAMLARKQLSEMTGMPAEAVTELEQADDGTWNVTVEVLELSRVPKTDDMIGSYRVQLDESGEMIGYRRVRRYPRSQADSGG
jgi:hypothetical protein